MSDEDLQRLAAILRSRNEGLAAINQDEADLLQALGGSAQPMAGTQGFGVGGGPIRSYDEADDAGFDSDAPSSEPEKPDQGDFETRIDVIAKRPLDTSGGDDDTPPPPPPPQYGPDEDGNMHSSSEALNAANHRIRLRKAAAKLKTDATSFTTDQSFDAWYATNKASYEGVSEDELKNLFMSEMAIVADEGRTEVPRMVELLNSYLQTTDPTTGKYINFSKTYDEFIAKITADNDDVFPFDRLSEPTLRAMWEKSMSKAMRKEAFELTPQEVAEFKRDAPQIGTVDDAAATTIGTIEEADAATVGDVAAPQEVTVDQITALTVEDIDTIGQLDDLAQELLNRIKGAATSPAQLQLKRATEQNLKQLLGLQAGAAADPARIRQLRNMWMATQQEATGQAAELRAQETIDAEKQLIEVYRVKGTMELQVELANLETRRQTAMKNGEFEQATELAIQQTALTRVISQASLETNINMANLEARRIKAVEQGRLDLATKLANLQKDLAIAQVNANLSLQSRSMDDALAIAAYKGDMAAQDLEVSIDLAQMQADLTKMGFTLQKDLAELDAATQRYVANLAAEWNRENNKQKRDDTILASLISLAGTALGTYAALGGSDIRMKKDIRGADSEVEGFLDALNAYQYQYKNPSKPYAEPGAFVGIMAQDLEKSSMGKSFVKDTPEGKVLNMNHGLAAILAGQANINERLRELENGSSR